MRTPATARAAFAVYANSVASPVHRMPQLWVAMNVIAARDALAGHIETCATFRTIWLGQHCRVLCRMRQVAVERAHARVLWDAAP